MAALVGSSSPPRGEDYDNRGDVFLHFYGPDAGLTVADKLCSAFVRAGFRVFKDDEEIRDGDAIRGKLLGAITHCKICIPIFSAGYASSEWCLREIAYVVECCRKSNDKVILPVFYEVDAKDLKFKSKLYRNALKRHTLELVATEKTSGRKL